MGETRVDLLHLLEDLRDAASASRASASSSASSPFSLPRLHASAPRIDTRRNDRVLLSIASGATMPDEMGSFRVDVEIENPARPGERRLVRSVLVDTGAELSWVPKSVLESLGVEQNRKWYFRQADGTVLERWTGIVVISIAGKRTGDDVVFGEPGDLVLLGSRTLEGLNVRIEPVTKPFVDPG